MNGSLILDNPTRQISRLRKETRDTSSFNHNETLRRIKLDVESSSVSTTIQNFKNQEMVRLIDEKKTLIQKRNKIIDNPIKCLFFPSFRRKLRAIDMQLDVVELRIYLLESEGNVKESDLNIIVTTAEARLNKYAKYLDSKE